ncbi:MAG TPA: LamG-like jellyroll fold domain-containing protein, partial [Puia sp.]
MMNRILLQIGLLVAFLTPVNNTARAQTGDQILDGIGETGMIARYVFDGDAKDWSRNNWHAGLHGAEVKFVNDSRFGKVLSLPGDNEAFVTIPGEALTDIESLSISGWIYLRSNKPGQHFFDFGRDAARHFFSAPAGTNAIEGNKWVYWAIVIDLPSKSMTTYVDGKPIGEARSIPKEFAEVTGKQPGEKQFYIGKSLLPGDPFLNALIHDFRIYRVPLSGMQVAGIYNNGLKGKGINEGVVNTTGKRGAADDLPHFPATEAQLYNPWLVQVADVEVETVVGYLPRLPSHLAGTYKGEMKGMGPTVRVIWPFATDNSAVLTPGRFTITGRVAGTDLHPKAFVTVKASTKPTTPGLKLATFDLSRVSLKTDLQGHQTQFI